MDYKDFFQEPENKKYNRYESNSTVEAVFNFMAKPESIDRMIAACEQKRPALEGIIESIEGEFPSNVNFDLEKDYTLRKAMGSMVKYILADFGYEVNIQKNISKGHYIKSATHYRLNSEKAKKRLVRKVTIEIIEE